VAHQFKIPALPPSVNRMYKISYRTKQCYLDESVRTFKQIAYPFIPPIKLKKDSLLKVQIEYHGKFYNADKSVKRRDGQNLSKCLYDIIFEKLGIDDKFAWFGTWKKVHNPEEEFTLVTIKELQNE